MKGKRRRYVGPLIAEGAVARYLNRKLDDWDWIKRAPRLTLAKMFDGFKFSERNKAWLQQLACLTIGTELPHFLFFLDMGGGKTGLVLALHRWRKQNSGLQRTLIMVPREVNIQSWIDEIEIHAPELTYTVLLGKAEERARLLQQETDLYLINYPGLQLYMSELRAVRSKKKEKRKRYIDPKGAKAFAERFDMVIFDESHRLGHFQSLVYHECRYFTRYCKFRYALTGTPFGRDPTMLWTQFHVVDDGETLGDSLGLFRAAFFNAHDRYWGGIEYTFDTRMEKELHQMIKHRSISYSDTEFSDLPPMPPPQRIRVNFSVSAHEQYQNVLRRIKEFKGSKEELENAFVRMRMCTSGFISVKSDIEGRLTMYFDENPKLDMLEEMIGDIPNDCKAIVYHDFILTGQIIGRMLERNKLPYATLSGRTKDPRGEIRRFKHDDSVRFLVANNESGSTGINPQEVANYMFFYESPVSPITRKQAVKRIHREGQKKRIYIYDLVVANSIDERILSFLDQGEDLFSAIIRGETKLLEAA